MPEETDLSRIDLNLLVLFEVVMRERHVGRSAIRLSLSPSAVSHGLGRLRRLLHDPLFLKYPKGVVPTERAEQLVEPIAEILQRVRSVVSSAEAFDAQHSTRRFTISAPDAVLLAVLPSLLSALAKAGPKIDLSTRFLLPQASLDDLDARRSDLVLEPLTDVPPRFVCARLYDEEFYVALRVGHPFAKRLTLTRYCAASHVLVSTSGAAHGNVDVELEKLGRSRRIAMTVPSFLLALTLVAESDLVAAVPRQALPLARRLGLQLVEPPAPLAPLTRSPINVIASRAALADAGVSWLFRLVSECMNRAPRRLSR